MSDFQSPKSVIRDFYECLATATPENVAKRLAVFIEPENYHWYGVYPFGEQTSAEGVASAFWEPFLSAWSPVQRRMDIFLAGNSEIDGTTWVMSMGHLMGLRDKPWLGIPASGKIGFLRYADFHQVSDGKIVKSGFFCDIIGVMHQVGINPLPQQTGASFLYPGPATHDGLLYEDQPTIEGEKTKALLNRMIADLDNLNKTGENRCPPELLAKSWHENMAWYGPAGIGASYTIRRYQQQHMYPFREGLKDKVYNGHITRFAEGNYACFFGWPNLTHTPTGGFLGLPGNEKRVDMRVVDVYRRQGDKLAENWVLIDLPWWLKQQGIDIIERTSSIFR